MKLDSTSMGTGSILKQLENFNGNSKSKRKDGAKKIEQDIKNTVNISAVIDDKEFLFGHKTHEHQRENQTLGINDDLPKNIISTYANNSILTSKDSQNNHEFLPRIDKQNMNTLNVLARSVPIVDPQSLFTIESNSMNDRSKLLQVSETIDESVELPEETLKPHRVGYDRQKLVSHNLDSSGSQYENRNSTKSPNERKLLRNTQASSQRK